jgi:hypothetical protein
MTELAEQKNGLIRALLVFCGTFVFIQVLFGLITYYFDFENPAMGVLITMVSAMSAGNLFATTTKRAPTRGEKLQFGILATICSFVLGFIGLWALFKWNGLPFNVEMVSFALAGGNMNQAMDMMEILPIVGGILAVLTVLLAYFGLWWGARQTLKQQAKLAAKA